ncbi:hypothetical protein DEM25_000025 [Oceaniradius stylonematis]|uniref:Uncharacterized protein n=1 Tax=Oceaniradius stylonematis TaxID=2184161 RepID=A0A3A8AP71_9HYPH|nr:hypothetical protein [Oceaniradius stylonematis]RKF08434.1 hypothetical protein DEM25_000025 [Oceaniradius stylonematis]
MSEIDQKPTLDEKTRPCEPSTDPDYLAWKERTVTRALTDAKANPDQLVSHAEMRRRFGLER